MRATILIALFFLAGCADPEPMSDEVVAPTPPPLPAEIIPVAAGPSSMSYEIDQASLTYENASVQFVFIAEEEAWINVTWQAQWAAVTTQDSCMAAGARSPGAWMAAAAWSAPANLQAGARVLGQGVTIDPMPTPDQAAGAAVLLEGWLSARLDPGESVVVHLGGDTSAAFGWNNPTGPANNSTMLIEAQGAHRVEREEVSLVCGVGTRTAKGGVGASWYLVEAEIGGSIHAETKNASTVWVLPSFDPDGMDELTVGFHGESFPLGQEPVIRHAPTGGPMSLTFDRYSEAVGGVAWLFTDADWVNAGQE